MFLSYVLITYIGVWVFFVWIGYLVIYLFSLPPHFTCMIAIKIKNQKVISSYNMSKLNYVIFFPNSGNGKISNCTAAEGSFTSLTGLLEVEPLHFTCVSTSDGTRIERDDASTFTGIYIFYYFFLCKPNCISNLI